VWGEAVNVKHLDNPTLPQNYIFPCVFVNLKMLFKFLLRTIHSEQYLIVLNRKIDQIIVSDLFRGVLLVSEIDVDRRMVELLDIKDCGRKNVSLSFLDIFSQYLLLGTEEIHQKLRIGGFRAENPKSGPHLVMELSSS
jgi:hypothetical protein